MTILDKEKLLIEIREKGVEISSIDELMHINNKYRDLVPVILKFIKSVDSESDKEFLVRCLAVKGFYEASSTLIQEFYSADNLTYKWAIGNTLSIISDETKVPEMLKIITDKKHGISRQMIVEGLGFFRTDEVKAALIDLLSDDDVVGHAIIALSKIGDMTAIKHIEPYLSHKVSWVRKTAAKAIKNLSKQVTTNE